MECRKWPEADAWNLLGYRSKKIAADNNIGLNTLVIKNRQGWGKLWVLFLKNCLICLATKE